MTSHFDTKVIVAGGGPAGLIAALLLAQEGVDVILAAPLAGPDPRTTALMTPSIRLLKYIKVWPGELAASTAPLQQLHMVDDIGNLVTGPTLAFNASEVGEEAFGWNVPIALLMPALYARAAELNIKTHHVKVSGCKPIEGGISVLLETGETISAQVCIAADGSSSVLREMAGIGVDRWSYDQDALVTTFDHSGPHNNTSIERHKPHGLITTVPMPGNQSSLVWLEKPARITALLELDALDLAAEIQAEIHGSLGLISNLGVRKSFPMRGMRANVFAQNRTILIGEAAHVFPPIGAQGLNMSFRDAAQAVDLIIAADDPGAPNLMQDYHDLRTRDIIPRQQAIGFMNQSLLSGFLPLELSRVAGLVMVNSLSPLRKWVMKEGLSPSSNLPYAMRA